MTELMILSGKLTESEYNIGLGKKFISLSLWFYFCSLSFVFFSFNFDYHIFTLYSFEQPLNMQCHKPELSALPIYSFLCKLNHNAPLLGLVLDSFSYADQNYPL